MTWPTVLIGLALIVAFNGGLFLMYRYFVRRMDRPARPSNPDTLLTNTLIQEVDDLKERVAELKAEVQNLKILKPPVSPYNQALHMAKQGFAALEVANSCGISRGEAELIIALYRKSKIKGVE